MKFYIYESDLEYLSALKSRIKHETLTYLDYRTIPTLEEAKEHFWYGEWFKRGTNHREDKEKNMIVCDVQEQGYTIEIASLEELAGLIDKLEDNITIARSHFLEAPLQITLEDY